MTQIYEWTPEILQEVRENGIWCVNQNHIGTNISGSASNWGCIINYKLTVKGLCETHPEFPRGKNLRLWIMNI
jgi:hypothetical protein